MLDTIQYTKTDNILKKTVTNITTVIDITSELAALEAQLADFLLADSTDEIAAAISNYQQQIAILQGI